MTGVGLDFAVRLGRLRAIRRPLLKAVEYLLQAPYAVRTASTPAIPDEAIVIDKTKGVASDAPLFHLYYSPCEVLMISTQQIGQVDQKTILAPAVLIPSVIEKMLIQRQEVQLPKFRTTCTDCVPNL